MDKRSITLAQKIAVTLAAYYNARKQGNLEWEKNHKTTLLDLEKKLPSGSGIDTGTHIILESRKNYAECEVDKFGFVLQTAFHHMNEHGMYDGWTEHQVRVKPTFVGIDLRISGRDRNQIKEYLYQVYELALTETWVSTLTADELCAENLCDDDCENCERDPGTKGE